MGREKTEQMSAENPDTGKEKKKSPLERIGETAEKYAHEAAEYLRKKTGMDQPAKIGGRKEHIDEVLRRTENP